MKAASRTTFHLLSLLLFISSCASLSSQNSRQTLSILQGPTSESISTFTVVAKKGQSISYYFSKGSERGKPIPHQRESQKHSDWVVDNLYLADLEEGVNYKLKAYSGDQLIDQREFRTMDLGMKRSRIAVASCLDDSFEGVQKKMWKEVRKKDPRMIFLIGDNIYADWVNGFPRKADPKQLWDRHVQTRNKLAIYKWPRLVPIVAIWDDHDYGANNSGSEYKHKVASAKIFREFFPMPEIPGFIRKGPGVSAILSAFGQEFVFLDNRSFRSPKTSNQPSQWGSEQEQWLIKELQTSTSPALIVQGDQFFGGYHRFESYEGDRPKSFKKMIEKLEKLPQPFMFLSGDRHLFEVMKIQKPDLNFTTYEITTSGIHAKMYPSSWEKNPNRRQIAGVALKPNFLLLESEVKGKTLDIKARAIGEGGELLYNGELKIQR
jgi:hypothetical protein